MPLVFSVAAQPKQLFVKFDIELKRVFRNLLQASDIRTKLPVAEDEGLSPNLLSAIETGADASGFKRMDRKGRLIFNPIVFLSRTTTNLIFTTPTTVTNANTATVFLATW